MDNAKARSNEKWLKGNAFGEVTQVAEGKVRRFK